MSNPQLHLAIGLPCITVMTALVVSLVQTSGIREGIRSLVSNLDLLTGKIGEKDTRLAVLEERVK
jgi:hypothetical protein